MLLMKNCCVSLKNNHTFLGKTSIGRLFYFFIVCHINAGPKISFVEFDRGSIMS